MDFDTLIGKLNANTQNGVLALDIGTDGDFQAISPFFAPFLPDGRLVIGGLVGVESNQTQQIVRGRGLMRFARLGAQRPLPIHFEFGIVQEQTHLAVTVQFEPLAALAAILVELRRTPFEHIYCQNAIAAISSIEYMDQQLQTRIVPGFNLTGRLDPNRGLLAKVAWMLGDIQRFTLHSSTMFHPTYGPQLSLPLPVAPDPLRALFGPAFVAVDARLQHRLPGSLENGLYVGITLNLGGQVTLAGTLLSISDALVLEARAPATALPQPGALLPSLKLNDLPDLLPATYRSLEGVSAHALTLAIGLSTHQLEYIELVLASTRPWPLLQGLAALAQSRVHLVLARGQPIQAALVGTLTIGDIAFDCEASHPYLQFSADLEDSYVERETPGRRSLAIEPATLTVDQLDACLPHPCLDLFRTLQFAQPLFTQVALLLDADRVLALDAVGASDWTFGIGRAILSVSTLRLSLSGDEQGSDDESPLEGQISIGGLSCSVVAMQLDDDWFLRARPDAAPDFTWSQIAGAFGPTWLAPDTRFAQGFIDIDLDDGSILVSGDPAPTWRIGPLLISEIGIYYTMSGSLLATGLLILQGVPMTAVLTMIPPNPNLRLRSKPNLEIPNLAFLSPVLGGFDLSTSSIVHLFDNATLNDLKIACDTVGRLASTRMYLLASNTLTFDTGQHGIVITISEIEFAIQLDFTAARPLVAAVVSGSLSLRNAGKVASAIVDLLSGTWRVTRAHGLRKEFAVTKSADYIPLLTWLLRPVQYHIPAMVGQRVTVRRPKQQRERLGQDDVTSVDIPDVKPSKRKKDDNE